MKRKGKLEPTQETKALLSILNDEFKGLSSGAHLSLYEKSGKKVRRMAHEGMEKFEPILLNPPVRKIIDLFLEDRKAEAVRLFNEIYPLQREASPSEIRVPHWKKAFVSHPNIQMFAYLELLKDGTIGVICDPLPHEYERPYYLVKFFSGPDRDRLRKCPNCSLYFFDNTTNSFKIFCSQRCRNCATSRNYYIRNK